MTYRLEAQKKIKLKKGFRWRRKGEWARHGDYCCDPRSKPVLISQGTDPAWKMTDDHHPVMTKVKK